MAKNGYRYYQRCCSRITKAISDLGFSPVANFKNEPQEIKQSILQKIKDQNEPSEMWERVVRDVIQSRGLC